jgi:hypothetical protein
MYNSIKGTFDACQQCGLKPNFSWLPAVASIALSACGQIPTSLFPLTQQPMHQQRYLLLLLLPMMIMSMLILMRMQILSTRARKEVALSEVKVPIVVFAFDCLFLNGKSMLHEPLTARREALFQALTPVEGQLMFATTKTSNNVEELEVGDGRGCVNQSINQNARPAMSKT